MLKGGYFTVERNIQGRSTTDIERVLGFRRGRLDLGARIWELLERPSLDQFELGGSTYYSDRKGLEPTELKPLRIPRAWLNTRLVKVDPVIPHTDGERYPHVRGEIFFKDGLFAAEQWVLKDGVMLEVRELCFLRPGDTYWRR